MVFTTEPMELPAALSTAAKLPSTRRVCAATSPSISALVLGSIAIWPEQNTIPLATIAWLEM